MVEGERLDIFLETLLAEKNFSMNTLNAYRRDLTHFINAMNLNKFEEVSEEKITEYLIVLRNKKISNRSLARKISSIKHFLRFSFNENWIPQDPSINIKSPKFSYNLPETLSLKQVNLLINSAKHVDKDLSKNIRNVALIELIYATGLRVTELVSLPLIAVIGNPEVILIKGKGRKERLVPLSKSAKLALRDWLLVRQKMKMNINSNNYLFPSKSKKGFLNREQFFSILKRLAIHAGHKNKKISPHVLGKSSAKIKIKSVIETVA